MIKKVLRNWGLKLISLVIAFLLWFVVVSTDNPKETQVYYNIPVILRNGELLEQENKVYEVLDGTDVVRVSVRAPRNVHEQLRVSDIVAEADMSKLTELNTIVINCSVPNFDVESVTASPDVMKLGIEEKRSRWVNVRSFVSGEVADGYRIINTVIDQNQVEVSGPKSLVDAISDAKIEIDVTGAISTRSANAEIIFYDAEGGVIEGASLKRSADYIRMEVEILPFKEVPVELNVTGEPAEGYLATGVADCRPSTVVLAGSASLLANVTKISIPQEMLDITGMTGNLEKTIHLREYLPANVKFADSSFNGKVSVTVYVEPKKERTLQIPASGIAVNDLPEGYTYSFEAKGQPYRLTVSGLEAEVNALMPEEIACSVDIGEWMDQNKILKLRPGTTYEIPVTVRLREGLTAESEFSVNIMIEELEDE